MVLEKLFNFNCIPYIFFKVWGFGNVVPIFINLCRKLKEASTVGEKGWDSVTNLTAFVVCGGECEEVCHLVRVAVGK